MTPQGRLLVRPAVLSAPLLFRALAAVLLALALLAPGWAGAEAQRATPPPKKVTVIGTGGTISGVSTNRVSFINYRSGQITIEDMVAQLQPELEQEVADVETVQFGNRGSGSYTIPEFLALSKVVEEELKTADGVVVTTGTDTMEEFAYWLDLTVRSRKPVVLTGSMRPWTVIGSDAQANLYNSIKLAASGRTKCFGAVLMLNDEFHAARDVTKTNTYRTDTFSSRRYGVLGYIDGPNIKVRRAPARVLTCNRLRDWRTPFNVSRLEAEDLPRVEIAYSYQGAGGEAIAAWADAGVEGIVTAGTGAGGIAAGMSAARRAAIDEEGVVFVSTSRTGSGSVYSSGPGIIAGDDLLPQKARLLLLLSLAFTDDEETIREWFARFGSGEWAEQQYEETQQARLRALARR